MSITVFMTLCILGLDLLIYAFFHRLYGDKRSAVARQVAAFKGQSPSRSASLHERPFMGAKGRPIEGSAEKQTAPANSHSGLPYGSANAKAARSRFLWPSTWRRAVDHSASSLQKSMNATKAALETSN